MERALGAFVIGSSLPATIWTLTYTGLAMMKKGAAGPDILAYPKVAIAIPLLFGIANVLANIGVCPAGWSYTIRMALVGAVFGLGLAMVGTFLLDLPRKIFGFDDSNWWVPLLIAPLMYAVIWGMGVNVLNRHFLRC